MLAHVAKNGMTGFGQDWFLAWIDHSAPFWIKLFDHPRTSNEIEEFLNDNEWWEPRHHWRSDCEYEPLDAAVCSNAWERVTGQRPTRTF
jgi:hypothetical protein